MNGVLLCVLMASLLGACSAEPDFSQDGPYSTENRKYPFKMGTFTGCSGRQCSITVTITKPRMLPNGTYVAGRAPPFPIIFFLNGFQMFSTYYKDYAEFLGSWGYVLVQYDLPALTITTDKIELRYLNPILDWLEDQSNSPKSFVYQLLDMERLAMAGHSRGAKLAALHLIQNPRIKGAYLIDPVDSDKKYAPESEDNPSAVRALTGTGKRLGVVGSGIVGSCNPPGANYVQFWGAVGSGSWLTIVRNCTHSQFLRAPYVAQAMFNMLCGTGKAANKNVIQATRPGLVAWMEDTLRTQEQGVATSQDQPPLNQQSESLLEGFFQWVRRMEQKNVFTFTVKNATADGADVTTREEAVRAASFATT